MRGGEAFAVAAAAFGPEAPDEEGDRARLRMADLGLAERRDELPHPGRVLVQQVAGIGRRMSHGGDGGKHRASWP